MKPALSPDASTFPRLRPAVFFDRDGTLMEDVHYCRRAEDVRVYPGVPEGLARLAGAGFVCVVVTNQSGIARGIISEEDYAAVNAEFLRQIGPGLVAATYYCADPPDVPTLRRKPAPGMVFEAAYDLGLDPARSWMVGDRDIDILCGLNAGCRTILVRTGHGAGETAVNASFTVPDAPAAIEKILRTAPNSTNSRPRP